MRTTLTLDEDVVNKLRQESRRTGRPFREVVNESIRLGLSRQRELKRRKKLVVNARALGSLPGLNYANIGELLEQIEGPGYQ